MPEQSIDVTIRARQLTEQAFKAVSAAMKALEDQSQQTGQKMTQSLKGALQTVEAKASAFGSSLQRAGAAATAGLTVPIVAGLGGAVKAAIDFETAFAGVRKTVAGTPAELGAIAEGFRAMAKEVPISVTELAKVGEMAGQLGVEKANIVAFSRTIADIATATNLTTESAGASFARLANIMRMPQHQFDELGSAVVALGNYGASTEQEMLDMALRLAGAGTTIGMTTPQVLGLANAMSSVGLESEAGGTALSRIMVKMATAVNQGGADLTKFATVAGVSAQQFAQAFKVDAGDAIVRFIEGLGRIQDSGGDLLGTLGALGVEEVRLRDALLRSANAAGMVRDSLTLGSKAFQENTELARAAGERYGTTENQLKLLWNQIKDVAIEIGTSLTPMLKDGLKALQPVVGLVGKAAEAFGQLPEPVRLTAVAVAGLVAAVGPVLVMTGLVAKGFASIVGALALVAPASATVAAGASTLTVALAGVKAILATVGGVLAGVGGAIAAFLTSPITIAVGAIAGLGLALRAITGSWDFILVPARAVWEVLTDIGTIVVSVARILGTVLVDALKGAWEWTKSLASGFTDFLVSGIKAALEWLRPLLDGLGWVWDKVTGMAGAVKRGLHAAAESAQATAGGVSGSGGRPAVARPTLPQTASLRIPEAPTDLPKGLLGPPTLPPEPSEAVKNLQQQLADLNTVLTLAQRQAVDMKAVYKEYGTAIEDTTLKARIFGLAVPASIEAAESAIKEARFAEELREMAIAAAKMAGEWHKGLHEQAKDGAEAVIAAAVATADAQRVLLETARDYQEQLTGATRTGVDARLAQIDREHREAVKKLGLRTAATADQYDRAQAAIDAYYQHERDVALGTADTIVERMRASGVETRADLEATAAAARRDYEQMRASGVFTAAEIREAWQRWYDADQQARGAMKTGWLSNLSELAGAFQQLAQIAGDSFSGITKGIGQVVASLDLAAQSVGQMQQGWAAMKDGFSISGLSDLVSGIGGLASAAISIGKTIVNAFRKPEFKRIMHDVGRDWGVSISEGLAKQIEADAARLFRKDRVAGSIFNLDQIIAEAGGLTSKNYTAFMGKLHDVFSMVDVGHFDRDQARQVLDENFGAFADLAREAAKKTGGILSRDLREIISLDKVFGTGSQAIADLVREEITAGLTGFGAFFAQGAGVRTSVADLRKELAAIDAERAGYLGKDLGVEDTARVAELDTEWDALRKRLAPQQRLLAGLTVTSQGAASGLAAALSGGIAEAVAGGTSMPDLLAQYGPAIEELQAQLEATGYTGGAAFESLQAKLAVVRDEIAGPLLQGITNVTQGMTGFYNAGVLDAEMLGGITAQIGAMYQQMVDGGQGGEASLELLKPQLQAIWQVWKETGWAIDDTTKKLLEDAEAAGLVGEKHRSWQDRFVDGIDAVVGRLDRLLDGLGVGLPRTIGEAADIVVNEAGRMADGIGGALSRIPSRIRIGVDATPEPPESDTVRGAAAGGLFSEPAFRVVAEREPEIVGTPNVIVDALAQALARVGGGLGGGTITIRVPNIIDGRVISELAYTGVLDELRSHGVLS